LKILFASPDRDLLECYKQLLEADYGEIVTAFDGTQVVTLLSTESFDLVILDREIPRIGYKRIIDRIREKEIPVIVLTKGHVRVSQLTQASLPNSYISFPFDHEQIGKVINNLNEKISNGEHLSIGNTEIDVSGFRIKDGPRLTCEEIDTLTSLIRGETLKTEYGAYISALNSKFRDSGAGVKIKYKPKKGFELVT